MKQVQHCGSVSLEIASAFLGGISLNCSDLMRDEEFGRRFKELSDYIDDKVFADSEREEEEK